MYTSGFKSLFFFLNLEQSLGFVRFSGYHTDDIPTSIRFGSDAYRIFFYAYRIFFDAYRIFTPQAFFFSLIIFIRHGCNTNSSFYYEQVPMPPPATGFVTLLRLANKLTF